MYKDQEIDELNIWYNHFVNPIQQDVTEKKILPLTDFAEEDQSNQSYEYEPSEEAVLETASAPVRRKLDLWGIAGCQGE